MLERPEDVPDLPGVYQFKKDEEILYIGKAKNLRKRLNSYFSGKQSIKEKHILDRATTVDYTVTSGELEALILEENEIKEHRPRYNIRMKDDKRYPYIKITTEERFPRVFYTRNLENDDALYFGPYPDVRAVRKALKTIREIFPIRTCRSRDVPDKECLNYHIDKCLAPCIDNISEEEYSEMIEEVIKFIKGKTGKLEEIIENKMWEASRNLNFEKAAIYRNQLLSLRKLTKKQRMVLKDETSRDIIGIYKKSNIASVVVFNIREGKMVNKEHYMMDSEGESSTAEFLQRFISTRYTKVSFIPEELILPEEMDERGILEDVLSTEIKVAKKGDLRRLIGMACKNARLDFQRELSQPPSRLKKSIFELQEILALENPPHRIEGFDISNIGGEQSTGSCVVFEGGVPVKSEYRRFRIKEVKGINDPAMIGEIISRRIKKIAESGDIPDLILVDGGKAQLNSAISIIKKFSKMDIPAVGLAKRMEELYLPDGNVLSLPLNSPALKLLIKIRNEAHRFALNYHRKLRRKKIRFSEIDEIEGIGQKRKISLIQHFGSKERLMSASREEIENVDGIGKRLSEVIYESLH